uniref:G-protein coupled receptors family 1 profile domain-containing protein n=1 Tax=Seriola dumerili TaxID=41447 RepID=A0A3B4TH04_SERDU
MMNVTNYYFFPAVYSLALVVGLPGNLIALFIFAFKITPRTAFSVYISNLALTDIVILCTLPFRIHYHINGNNWVFGDIACRITGILFFANIYMNICFMTCICVDRYMATVRPHSYLRLQSCWCSLAVSVVLWCVAGVAMVVFVLMGPLETDGDESGSRSCFENFAKHEWATRLGAYSVLCLIFGSLLPSMIILVCYPLAARRISMIKSKTAQRAVRVIYTILGITLLCFLPNHLVYLLHLLRRMEIIKSCSASDAIYHARRVTMALVILNTCLDPLLYFVTTSHCRWKGLKRTWLCGQIRRSRGVYTIVKRNWCSLRPSSFRACSDDTSFRLCAQEKDDKRVNQHVSFMTTQGNPTRL